MRHVARYELPRLPYGEGELEPFAGAGDVRAHRRIHAAYADGLNSALDSVGAAAHPQHISAVLQDLGAVPEGGRDAVGFFGGGFENHRMLWDSVVPGGGGGPGGGLADAIDVYFGGFGEFRSAFARAALSVEGSGWCWLVFDPAYGRLEVMCTAGEASPWAARRVPLLGLDVWEHAHYARYGPDRGAYVGEWWGVVNWDYAEGRYEAHAG